VKSGRFDTSNIIYSRFNDNIAINIIVLRFAGPVEQKQNVLKF
jgi:hypothetical protein